MLDDIIMYPKMLVQTIASYIAYVNVKICPLV